MNKAIWYKGSYLMPNSDAYQMYNDWTKENNSEKKSELKKKLDQHIKVLEHNWDALLGKVGKNA